MFLFQEQLKVGDAGEQLILENYPRKLVYMTNERKYDFLVNSSRETIEVKTDTYTFKETDNFFLERYSDVKRKTPGGPWRAAEDNIDIFIYLYLKERTWFEFRDLPKLISWLDAQHINDKRLIWVRNRGYHTAGVKIKRSELANFYREFKF